jgi:hypothetical protein
MNSKNKFCQSCGKPMKNDMQAGGTNADGSKNYLYCSYCYQDGNFTFNGTLKEFKKHCIEVMRQQGVNKFFAWIITLGMKRLDRWK